MHGGADHVVGVFHPGDGYVGHVRPDDRVADGMVFSVEIGRDEPASTADLHLRKGVIAALPDEVLGEVRLE